MPNKKFTGGILERIKPLPGESRTNYFDSAYGGLCLRVGQRDKTWCYWYRFDGKKQYKRLGKFIPGRVDHMDREGAIAAADEINQQVDKGINPKSVRKPVKTKPTVKNPNSLKRRVKAYLKLYKGEVKESTYSQAKRLLEGPYLKRYEDTDVSRISRAQLVELLEDMADTPAQANRLHAYLNKFFSWCWDREYCDPSPMVGLKKRFGEKKRKRYPVIPPFSEGSRSRAQAAMANFCFGVIPPMPIFGRS